MGEIEPSIRFVFGMGLYLGNGVIMIDRGDIFGV